MKRTIAFVSVLLLIMGLVGCGYTNDRGFIGTTNHDYDIVLDEDMPGTAYDQTDCPTCGGLGIVPNNCFSCGATGMCSNCNGSGYVFCKHCISGKCMECGGDGKKYNTIKDYYETCRICHGSGTCNYCKGYHEIACNTCRGSGICSKCNNETWMTCRTCGGRRYVTVDDKSAAGSEENIHGGMSAYEETGTYTLEYSYPNDEKSIVEDSGPVIVDQGECGDRGGNVTWTLYDDGLLVISGSGKIRDYSISSNIPDDAVIVVIEDGVTDIGAYTFFSLDITEIDIPDSVTAIGKDAFSHCTKLTEITLPDSITDIGDNAFYLCHNLTNVVLSKNVTHIGTFAFAFCNEIESITLPECVSKIENYAFDNWKSTQTIYIQGKESAPSGWDKYWKRGCSAYVVWAANIGDE